MVIWEDVTTRQMKKETKTEKRRTFKKLGTVHMKTTRNWTTIRCGDPGKIGSLTETYITENGEGESSRPSRK
jgi:hypothetical protein